MEASIVELRYKMKNVLQSLARNESVKIYYHKKWIATITPRDSHKEKRKIKEHSFFGMHAKETESVEEQMNRVRGVRYSDI